MTEIAKPDYKQYEEYQNQQNEMQENIHKSHPCILIVQIICILASLIIIIFGVIAAFDFGTLFTTPSSIQSIETGINYTVSLPADTAYDQFPKVKIKGILPWGITGVKMRVWMEPARNGVTPLVYFWNEEQFKYLHYLISPNNLTTICVDSSAIIDTSELNINTYCLPKLAFADRGDTIESEYLKYLIIAAVIFFIVFVALLLLSFFITKIHKQCLQCKLNIFKNRVRNMKLKERMSTFDEHVKTRADSTKIQCINSEQNTITIERPVQNIRQNTFSSGSVVEIDLNQQNYNCAQVTNRRKMFLGLLE